MSIDFYGDPGNPLAIVIRASAKIYGIEFYSPEHFPQQLGLMTRPEGYEVLPHIHNSIRRTISETQEVLVIRNGRCEISLFGTTNIVQQKITLEKGDVILLAHGGHGIRMLTECEILEVKQGPFVGAIDKTHFLSPDL